MSVGFRVGSFTVTAELLSRTKTPIFPQQSKSGSYPTRVHKSDCGATWSECGGIGIRKKLPLTEQYRRRKYEMPASHPAVRRTLAGRGAPEPPLKKRTKEGDTMRKRNRTITIRCTDEEYERIHNKAQRHKLSLSDFILRSTLDKKIVVADGLDEVAKQQKAIGRNLNQIAMLAHEGRLHSVRLVVLV